MSICAGNELGAFRVLEHTVEPPLCFGPNNTLVIEGVTLKTCLHSYTHRIHIGLDTLFGGIDIGIFLYCSYSYFPFIDNLAILKRKRAESSLAYDVFGIQTTMAAR